MALRVVFMGTPEYGAKSLEALLQAGYQIVGVFTQPDRPKGRGNKLQQSPVKLLAQEHGIPVFQPEKIRLEGYQMLKDLRPDLCVSAAFGQILSEEILALPRLGTINVHASLLPKYRGSSPVQWCLINGESKTGVSTMMTDSGIDTGDILLSKEVDILEGERSDALLARLGSLGAALLIETLEQLEKGTLTRTKQDESRASYYPLIKKEMGCIDWKGSAKEIADKVRGLYPWPCAYSASPHGILKILKAHAGSETSGQIGEIMLADPKEGLAVRAGDSWLYIDMLQAQGGKAMDAKDYLRGHALSKGASMMEENA